MTRKSTLEMEGGGRGDIVDRPGSIILLPGLVGVFQPCYTHMLNGHLRHCMILKGFCNVASHDRLSMKDFCYYFRRKIIQRSVL